jgi:glutathione S-transferase
MRTKLYVIPVSHSAVAARLMLDHKGLEYETVSMLSGSHPARLRLMGFPAGTVPALSAGDERIQGSLTISRFLDSLQPDPPLFPGDPEQRRRVEEAETWGGTVLQDVPRRLFRWTLVHDPALRRKLARANGMPLPGLMGRGMKPVARYFAGVSGADDPAVRRDLEQLPELLDHADALIDGSVIGASLPNAATFQIGPSLRLLMNLEQLRPLFADRPSARFARELLPRYPGEVGPVFPAEWLEASSPH